MNKQDLMHDLNHYKHKMYMHIEERNSYNVNKGYIEFLENKIEEIQAMLNKMNEIKAVAS